MPRPRRILLLLGSMVGAALIGWIAAASMAPETRARASRLAEDQQLETLIQQLQSEDKLSEAERMLLLEHLVAEERLLEAELVLQPWLSGHFTPRELHLFKAELQRRNGQPEAARRSLQQLMRLHPNDPQVLQLLVLLDQHQGRQSEATAALTARFNGLEPGQRMEIGLLLADLLRQGGSPQTAKTLYHQLAEEEPTNPRPLLALALLLQEQGHGQETQALLKQARQRRDANGRTDPSIDRLAGQLGLSTARNSSAEQRGSTAIREGSGAP